MPLSAYICFSHCLLPSRHKTRTSRGMVGALTCHACRPSLSLMNLIFSQLMSCHVFKFKYNRQAQQANISSRSQTHRPHQAPVGPSFNVSAPGQLLLLPVSAAPSHCTSMLVQHSCAGCAHWLPLSLLPSPATGSSQCPHCGNPAAPHTGAVGSVQQA